MWCEFSMTSASFFILCYCQCFSNFECQSINLFQVLNWYILTFDNKCAQKQFYFEIYVICKIQTIFNIDSFVLFVIQTEVLCQIMKRFLIYLFLQNTTQKQTQSFLFYVVEKNTSSLFNDLFIKCSSCLRSALYFLITVNLFNMSIIDLFPQLNEIQIWPTKSIYRLKVFVWSVKSLLVSSHFVSGQLWTFSNLDFFSRGWERAELY